MARKLSQLLAVEKTVKSKREDEFTKLYRDVQVGDLISGLVRTYQPKDDEGDKLPPESKKVALRVEDALRRAVEVMAEVFDLTTIKNYTNTVARADVVVDSVTIFTQVPALHLLWMEQKLQGIADFIKKLPTLSTDEVWSLDAGTGLYRTEPTVSFKNKKVTEFVEASPATKEHPAQVKEVSKDVVVGTWTAQKLSGAITEERKAVLVGRVEKYLKAVKEAREEANQAPVIEATTSAILKSIFAP